MFLQNNIIIGLGISIVTILAIIGIVQIIKEIFLSFSVESSGKEMYSIVSITDSTLDTEQLLRGCFTVASWRGSSTMIILCLSGDMEKIRVAQLFSREHDIVLFMDMNELKDYIICKKS